MTDSRDTLDVNKAVEPAVLESTQFYLWKDLNCAYTVHTASNHLARTSAIVLIHPVGDFQKIKSSLARMIMIMRGEGGAGIACPSFLIL